jgi:hypothetical protein
LKFLNGGESFSNLVIKKTYNGGLFMGLDMYLFSYPKIERLSLYETRLASSNLDKHEKQQDEVY